ncbi:MAG: thioredoxin family protein, partial [Pseudomonadota bacterium]
RGGQLAATRAPARLFPAGHEIVHAAEQTVRYGPEGLQIDLVPDDAFPGALAGTLVAGDIAVDITAQAGPVLPRTQGAGFGPPVNLPLLVLLALIGGLILNLMPCVLPVLSIKAFGIVTASAQGGQGEARAHGLWYTAGVLATFAALAVAIVSVRAATGISTWGFWLQSAPVVTALILIVFLIGLWLLGMFDLGRSVQNMGSGLAARQGSAGAFFTGVLAAIVGAPCTGPFLGAALGAIMGRPAIEVFIVLIAMGLGMALPFLLISFVPSLHRRLPKPGVWMDTLKQVFAFPMFLTAAWLLSVLGALAGFRAAAMVVAGAVLIGFGIWVIRSAETGGRAILMAVAGLVSIIPIFWLMGALSADSITLAPLIQGLAGLLILVGAIYLFAKLPAIRTGQVAKLLGAAAIIVGLSWPMFGMRPAVATDAAVSSYSYAVEAWSDARVAELQAEGRPIFVDFTAEWCATCQANKLQALRTGPVTEAFLAANVAFLEADFTRPDSAISAALKQHNRAGVPLYLWYAPGETEPQILPEILSVDLVTNLVAQIG